MSIWASWCPPCVQEAPALETLAPQPDRLRSQREIAARRSLEVPPTSDYVSPKGRIVGFVFGPGTVQTFEQRLQIARIAR